ncbi:hydroxymethylglutaryl-CoA lyase, mitochondrial-like [Camellia sinensis]|uniref:hydroxymethylglutaryl-CoA lyase, mitochondrial-like n=1 Tax=Camellia sinensis TaxID=4442 RepID=UPI001036BE9C|nr:hydroxymethylglutaryl-CoA lyase, mitochondrial-like [Camellia sinensis]
MSTTDAKDVLEAIQCVKGARFPILTPNLKGFEAAVAAGAKEVAIFAAASESFSMSNINCSIEDSLARYRDVALAAKKLSIPVLWLKEQ